MKPISETVSRLKPSGIRKFFDLASTMEGVISLGVGEPDFATPWHICENAVQSMNDGCTHYTANRGLPELRRRIAAYHARRFGQIYDPEKEIIVTVGGSEGIDLAMRTLLNPGDEVIVLDPNYVAYAPAIELAKGVPVPVTITKENEFKLRPEALKAALTDKTKAVILNFPSNPTGGVMNKEDYAALVPVIKESGIYVISDEIYAELLFDGEFASPAQFPEIKDQVIVINGFSKAFAMTGWRLGYVLSQKDISSAMNKVHQYVIMSAPTPAQYAAIEALDNGMEDVDRMREDYRRRRNLLVARLNRMGLPTIMPHGTFYVFPDIRSTGLDSESFCAKLLEEQKVACVPGTAFGPAGEGHIRISYAYSLDHIKEALDRMEHFLDELKKRG
jgi:aminotransferase